MSHEDYAHSLATSDRAALESLGIQTQGGSQSLEYAEENLYEEEMWRLEFSYGVSDGPISAVRFVANGDPRDSRYTNDPTQFRRTVLPPAWFRQKEFDVVDHQISSLTPRVMLTPNFNHRLWRFWSVRAIRWIPSDPGGSRRNRAFGRRVARHLTNTPGLGQALIALAQHGSPERYAVPILRLKFSDDRWTILSSVAGVVWTEQEWKAVTAVANAVLDMPVRHLVVGPVRGKQESLRARIYLAYEDDARDLIRELMQLTLAVGAAIGILVLGFLFLPMRNIGIVLLRALGVGLGIFMVGFGGWTVISREATIHDVQGDYDDEYRGLCAVILGVIVALVGVFVILLAVGVIEPE